MVALSKQVDLDEVDVARQQFPLVSEVQFARLFTGRLVREAEDFDRGHKPLAIPLARIDSQKRLAELVVHYLDDDRSCRTATGYRRGPGGRGCNLSCSPGAKHAHVGLDR